VGNKARERRRKLGITAEEGRKTGVATIADQVFHEGKQARIQALVGDPH